jgi:sulfur carrier protein ThiS adenylyltransferase
MSSIKTGGLAIRQDFSRLTGLFSPPEAPITIIGCGATGSHLAWELARMGVMEMNLFDFDVVEAHNLQNQKYFPDQVGQLKVEALGDNLRRLNPALNLNIYPVRATGQELKALGGYFFFAVDTFKARLQLVQALKFSPRATKPLYIFDTRMGVKDIHLLVLKMEGNNDLQSHYNRYLATVGVDGTDTIERSPCGTPLAVGATASITAAQTVQLFMQCLRDDSVVPNQLELQVSHEPAWGMHSPLYGCVETKW